MVASDGTVMHGLALIYILRDMPAVRAFKIIQESLNLTRVQVVANPSFGITDEKTIREGLLARLGSNVEIDIQLLAEIPPEKSGKHRYVVSQVKL